MPPKRKAEMDDIVQSRIIKFIVGKGQVECNIHEAVIINLSDPLRALVTNGMRESIEAKVAWEDVEMSTFTKFSQFAYEHDYTIIDPEEEKSDTAGFFTINEIISRAKSRKNGWRTTFLEEFMAEYLGEEGNDAFVDWEKKARFHSHAQYMSHAQLYILADCYAISGLVSLSVQKIREMLVNNPLDRNIFDTVWRLLGFVWTRTTSEDKLRKLLLQFLLLDLEDALNSPEAAHVCANTPEIAAALMLTPSISHWSNISIGYE
ncbi:hypothetical protein LX36DRAFT_649960 [Colletotrichum falcatum]|nr:hypothetical protein LX36DRAFT_649960 [Colletotrichum falcatum]